MPQKIIGIDVGSYAVKIAEVVRSLRTFEFVGFYERRIQYNELLTPEESTAIALQGLIDDHRLEWESVITGFPGQRVSSRLLTFPFGGAKKIEQTVRFEIESYIPFDAAEVVIDYATSWATKEASRVLVVYAQKTEFAKYLAMLTGLNIDPRSVCVEGIEFVNVVNLGMVPPEGGYAILDVGHEKTNITLCHAKRLGYVRAVSIAGKAITQAIATTLGVPLDEAERMKIEMGHLPTADEEMDDLTRGVVESIRKVIDELVLHLRQTLFAYRDQEGVPIEGLYLCGGTSRLPGLDRYLSDVLRQNVTFINPTDFHFTRLEVAAAHRHVIPQALALALKGVASGGAPAVNLRQGEFAFKGDVERLGGSMRQAAIALAAIVGLAFTSFAVNYYTLKGKLGKVQMEAKEVVRQAIPDAPAKAVATPKTALGLIKSRQAELADRKAKLEALLARSPLDILKEISTLLPPRNEVKLDVEKLTIAADRALLSGSTDSFEAVDRIKQALEKSTMFPVVTSGNVRKGVKGEVKFDLSLEFEKKEKET